MCKLHIKNLTSNIKNKGVIDIALLRARRKSWAEFRVGDATVRKKNEKLRVACNPRHISASNLRLLHAERMG
jgi:hypothetical protein